MKNPEVAQERLISLNLSAVRLAHSKNKTTRLTLSGFPGIHQLVDGNKGWYTLSKSKEE
jgi:hypothetical protein